MTKISEINTTNEIRGYITGFFDAEGLVGVYKLPTGYSLEIVIVQSCFPVLEKINNVIKGKIKQHHKEGYDKKGVYRKNAWHIVLNINESVFFLEYVYPYLIEKRKQADLAIQFYKNRFNLTSEQKEYYYNEIKRLKHEQHNEKELKNHENEIKKLSISRETREGKQLLIPGFTLEDMYKERGATENKDNVEDYRHFIPEMPDNVKIGYTTGFFDGEGFVGISKDKRNKNSYSLNIYMKNTNLDILKLFNDRFGGSIVENNETDKPKNHKNVWRWYLNSINILPFLKQIEPYTIVKEKQVELAIEFQEWHNQIGRIRSHEQKQKAEWYYNRIKELKKETGEECEEIE